MLRVANSDRRPVDPPPVVELRIKQGDKWEGGREITFDYNASFFLYASLEQHRKISSGRMGTQTFPPILTGVPASGMAYLDRPTAAGYFIFPDLSVRHEGQYRLSFSLFETTKLEADFDLEPTEGDLPPGVDWRMDIKTDPFDVYSAKKFPGLMESTPLSKEVADQGCRVRIRRDVRMRKREGKANGNDRREESYNRRRAVSPVSRDDSSLARARSMSNSSEHQRGPYIPEQPRRPSIVDAYPHPPPPPPQSSYEPAGRGHLSFGSDHGAPQYAAPRQYTHQPLAPVSPSPFTPTTQYAKTEPQGYPYAHPPSRGGLPSSSPGLSHDSHSRRTSGNLVPPSPSIYSPEGHIRHDSHSSYSSTPMSAHPPKRIAPQHQPSPQPQPQQHPRSSHSVLKISNLVSDMAPIEPQTEPIPMPAPTPVGGKRKHEVVFSQSSAPLHNRARPRETNLPPLIQPKTGGYLRADGSRAVAVFNQFY